MACKTHGKLLVIFANWEALVEMNQFESVPNQKESIRRVKHANVGPVGYLRLAQNEWPCYRLHVHCRRQGALTKG